MEDSRDILKFDETGTMVTGCKDKSVTKIVIPEGVTSTGYAYRHHPAFAGKFKEVIIEK